MIEAGSYSRTKKGVRNGAFSLSFKILSLLLGFISRKLFLDVLGSEVLGVDSVANSILGFLNIAELGIGSAVSVTLYKPLYENDKQTVKEIVALQGWLYKIIASFIISGSLVVACFFPSIFSKSEIPLWYAYCSFGAALLSSMTGYFISYKYIVLSADQNDYKVTESYNSIILLKIVLQIICVRFCPGNPFIWWIGLEASGGLIASISLTRMTNRTYPYLTEKVPHPSLLVRKYSTVVTKVKQLFFQKVGSLAIGKSGPIIIYAFVSLSSVTLYNNYQILINSLHAVTTSLFSGLTASLGSLVASNDPDACRRIFKEQFALFFLIAISFSVCLWFLCQPFVIIWLGDQFLLGKTTVLLMVAIFYLGIIRFFFDSFLSAYGLFQDIWCPITEAVINITLSILLGKAYGLNGIITGILISQLFIHVWKPIFLFWKGLRFNYLHFLLTYAKYVLIAIVAYSTLHFAISAVNYTPDTIVSFLLYASVVLVSTVSILFIMLYLSDSGMRAFVRRMINIVPGIRKS